MSVKRCLVNIIMLWGRDNALIKAAENLTTIFVPSCDLLYNGLQFNGTSFGTALHNIVFKLVAFPSWYL